MTPLLNKILDSLAATPSHLEVVSNSQVLIAAIGVIGSLAGVYITYYLSTKKPTKKSKQKIDDPTAENNVANYAGYESIIKRLDAENARLDIALTTVRKNETRLYEVIESKNQEIDRLKHLHEYADHANKVQS